MANFTNLEKQTYVGFYSGIPDVYKSLAVVAVQSSKKDRFGRAPSCDLLGPTNGTTINKTTPLVFRITDPDAEASTASVVLTISRTPNAETVDMIRAGTRVYSEGGTKATVTVTFTRSENISYRSVRYAAGTRFYNAFASRAYLINKEVYLSSTSAAGYPSSVTCTAEAYGYDPYIWGEIPAGAKIFTDPDGSSDVVGTQIVYYPQTEDQGWVQWQPNHAYSLGDQIGHNGNVYLCYQAGVSGTQGPSGLLNIADGTVWWSYRFEDTKSRITMAIAHAQSTPPAGKIPAGYRLQAGSGQYFRVISDTVVGAGVTSYNVACQAEEAGIDGNVPANTIRLQPAQTLPAGSNFDPNWTVDNAAPASGGTGATDSVSFYTREVGVLLPGSDVCYVWADAEVPGSLGNAPAGSLTQLRFEGVAYSIAGLTCTNTLPASGGEDSSALERALPCIKFNISGRVESVHDGTTFMPGYADLSAIESVPGGYLYSVKRTGGWTDTSITLYPAAYDVSGNEMAPISVGSWAVSIPSLSVTLVSPTNGAELLTNADPLVVDLVGDIVTGEVVVNSELVYAAGAFQTGFLASSTKVAVTDGYRLSIVRDAGWVLNPTMSVLLIDTRGNHQTAYYTWLWGASITGTPPVITIISPPANDHGRSIYANTFLVFEVTDPDDNLRGFYPIIYYPDGSDALVHDGTSFRPNFATYSTRDVITHGYRFRIRPNGGWAKSPSLFPVGYDEVGLEIP